VSSKRSHSLAAPGPRSSQFLASRLYDAVHGCHERIDSRVEVAGVRYAGLIAGALVVAAVGFAVGRFTHPSSRATTTVRTEPGRYSDGYHAGREAAFQGFDGGWGLGDPYIVVLRRGPSGTTYRFARRWAVLPGREYRSCTEDVICSGPAHP
jgi:hypothetical protein